MKFVNFKIPLDNKTVSDALKDTQKTNQKLKIPDGGLIPSVIVRDFKNDFCRIRCLYLGGPTKDDGFVEGTFFIGKMKNTDTGCRMRGVILTEPVFHILFSGLFVFLTVKTILAQAIPVTPLCLAAFVIFMFRKEYKKQKVLYEYMKRSVIEAMGK